MHSTNAEIIDALSQGRSPNINKQTSMEHLIDPEELGDQMYNVPDVPLSLSVGPYDNRLGGVQNGYNQSNRQQGRFRSPSHNVKSEIGFSSPSQYGAFGSPSQNFASPHRNIRSPAQKLSYDETDDGTGFGSANMNSPNGRYRGGSQGYNHPDTEGFNYGSDGRYETGEFGKKAPRRTQNLQGQRSPNNMRNR